MIVLKGSLPTRGVWIEIRLGNVKAGKFIESLPTRGVWIEILQEVAEFVQSVVAPHTGSVD